MRSILLAAGGLVLLSSLAFAQPQPAGAAQFNAKCASCHNGTTATGKPVNHIATNNVCEDCHVTANWTTIHFDHSAVSGTCASCHNHSDPIGLVLEGFDTIGARRTKENGVTIDLKASLQGKSFEGAEGLGKVLHDSPKFSTCLAKKVYAYGRGENSEDVGAGTIKTAYKAFQDSGYRLRALLKSMATSPEFYAAPTPVIETKSAETTSSATRVAAQ